MKLKLLVVVFVTTVVAACGPASVTNNTSAPKASVVNASPTPIPKASVPKNGDYNGKGVVTKIDPDGGSIGLDHEEIKDMMPAMQMEFFVSDKNLLKGLKIGDKVDFVVRYKDPTETIVDIK